MTLHSRNHWQRWLPLALIGVVASADLAADTVDQALLIPSPKTQAATAAPDLQRRETALHIDLGVPVSDHIPLKNTPKAGTPLQIGFARAMPKGVSRLPLGERGEWRQGTDGHWSLLIDITSTGAPALRASLQAQSLPKGTRIGYFDANGKALGAPRVYNNTPREIWSPITAGERLSMEIRLPADSNPAAFNARLGPVSHFVVSPFNAKALFAFEKNAGACNLDAVCYEDYAEVRKAVSRIVFSEGGGSYTCTGTLLNDSDSDDQRLYYLSANHCISSQAVADTMTTLWYEQSAVCDSPARSPQYKTFDGGAALLSTDEQTDTSLFLLRDNIDVPVVFAGWSTSFTPGDVVGIHHPSGDFKKISFGQVLGYSGKFDNTDLPESDPNANFLRAIWVSGTTEGGSSGSAILDGQNRVVGTLYGGSASCDNPTGLDRYGRFDRAYERNEWNKYLFTSAAEKPVTLLKDGAGAGTVSSSPAGISCSGDCQRDVATFNKGASITLTATPIGTASFAGWGPGDCDSQPAANQCVISANSGRIVKARFNPDLTAVAAAVNDDGGVDPVLGAAGEPWEVSNTESVAGGSSATSANISDNEFSELSIDLVGPGELTFYWKVSSEADYDFLEVARNGVVRERISGEVDWQQATTIPIVAGNHTVSWTFRKDESVSEGNDRGWIDSVVYTPDGSDRDGDGVADEFDAFPDDPNESVDNDNDGLGANAELALGTSDNDADSDDDGYTDLEEVNANTNPLLASSNPGPSVLRLLLEEPVDNQSHSGVGNLRGWAVASDGIEKISIYIDGVYVFDAPYGGQRPDVAASFPDVANSESSGFSLAYNYGNLSAGEHTVRAVAETSTGRTVSSEATMTVIRFGSSFISDPNAVDVAPAQCTINNRRIDLLDALIEGSPTDISLEWRTASQGFELIRIESQGAN